MKIDLSQLEFIDPFLRHIAMEVEEHFDVEFTVTSLYRIGDPGVHGAIPLRGIDLRCKNHALGASVAEYINDKYIYDPMRPEMVVCKFHDAGSGYHIHLQVHPLIELRNK